MIKKVTRDELDFLFSTTTKDWRVTFIQTGAFTLQRIIHPKSYKTMREILEKARYDLTTCMIQFDQMNRHITYNDQESHYYYYECEDDQQFHALWEKFLSRSIDYHDLEALYPS